MSSSWWSRRFTGVLESYGLGARMQRGRRYARTGQVIELEVSPGLVAAQVQGSRPTPYLVTAAMAVPSDEQWSGIVAAMRRKVGFVAHLLNGEVPEDLEEVFAAVGVPLFPETWSDVRGKCSCPDWENPCKHLAAVLYVLADLLDTNPWLALQLRGRERGALLRALGTDNSASSTDVLEVAPWWPIGSDPVPTIARTDGFAATRPERADAVLDGMEALDVAIGGSTFVELLRPIYVQLLD
jgi:uncharacterized Zn finger protein